NAARMAALPRLMVPVNSSYTASSAMRAITPSRSLALNASVKRTTRSASVARSIGLSYTMGGHGRAVLPDRRSAHDPRPRAEDRAGADRAARRALRRDGDLPRGVDQGDRRGRPLRH